MLAFAGLTLLLGFGDPTPTDQEILRRAEKAFQAGLAAEEDSRAAHASFARAAKHYNRLEERGVANVDLYRNEGNAALLAGRLGEAVYAYRRGLVLAPGDPFLQEGLAQARQRVNSDAPDRVAWTAKLSRWAASWLVFVLLAFYSAGWILCYRGLRVGSRWQMSTGLGSFVVSLILATPLVAESWVRHEATANSSVVVAGNGILLRQGNGILYPPKSDVPLRPGTEARVLAERSGWLKIELLSRQTGWIPTGAVLRI
jgi:hypothetical protein